VQQFNAMLEKARLDYDGALRLKSGGYQSRTAIADALSRLETAKADAKKAKLDLANLQIRAPFAGVVDARPVEIGDFMQRADVCARVLDMSPLLVTGRIAESSVALVQNHSTVQVALASGQTVEGKVRFIERNADEITRTFRLEALVENTDLMIRSGLTAQMIIPVGATKAHLVSASLLALDDQGKVGVKVLDSDNVVNFHLVEIIGDEKDGVWVQGLPEHTTLITVGQQYVTSGETVIPTLDSAKASLSAAQL
jgi:multidrug efflux system membrane fusion protein